MTIVAFKDFTFGNDIESQVVGSEVEFEFEALREDISFVLKGQ